MSLSPQAIFSQCLSCSEVENCSDCHGKDEYRNYTAQAYENPTGTSHVNFAEIHFLSFISVMWKDILCVLQTAFEGTENVLLPLIFD